MRRSGVIARLASSRRSAVRPVWCVISSIGFAPSPSLAARYARSAAGTSAAATSAAWIQRRCIRRAPRARSEAKPGEASEILPQIHARVEARDLVAVAVERQRRPAPELADAPLALLAPARM